MNNNDSDFDQTTPCEGSEQLNGKDASFRQASMISAPNIVIKRRVRGALVPMSRGQ